MIVSTLIDGTRLLTLTRKAPRRNATGPTLQMGKVGVMGAATGRTAEFTADRTRGHKAFSNGADTALVVAYGHHDGTLLCRQVGIDS